MIRFRFIHQHLRIQCKHVHLRTGGNRKAPYGRNWNFYHAQMFGAPGLNLATKEGLLQEKQSRMFIKGDAMDKQR